MSSGQLNPIDNPQAWDVIVIGSATSPGICKVSEFKRAFEWDVKKGKGTFGSTVTFVGRPPAKGSITFYLWTAQHFTDWETFRPLLKYDPTKNTVKAVDIFHPSLADIGISSVVTESLGNIVHEGNQLYSVKVDFLEYFPPPKKSAVSTPNTSDPNTGGKNKSEPTAQSADEAQAGALLDKAAALGGDGKSTEDGLFPIKT